MKRRLAIFSVIATLVLGVGMALSRPALAQVDTGLTEVGQTVKLSSADPRTIAVNIINISLGLIGIILVSLIIYAGFLYMTSGGEAEKTAKAKKIITSAIIGLVIVLSSWAIARFVIERLLQATGGGGGTTQTTGGGGLGGGFGGGGISNVFQVKSIAPQGSVPLRNVQVKMLFTRPVDQATVAAIVVTKTGGTTVGGTMNVAGSLVTFTPLTPCPAPNETLFCFDGDSEYTVQIGSALRSLGGQSLVCGGFAPACNASFRTGTSIDTQSPTAVMTVPQDGQAVPSDSLISLEAHTTDDSGIAAVEFSENGNLIDAVGPTASSSPTTFDAMAQWDTAGVALQSEHQIRAKASDIDTHETISAPITVVVRSSSCFDGVKNGDETDVDCGGTPNTPGFCGACSGGSCTSNSQCASGVCQAGICVEQPIITNVTPLDGRPGTIVTITGSNFGTGGTVVFLGGAGAADDIVATPPASCSALGNLWSSSQIIVAVPAGAAIGPIKVTNGTSNLSDATNDARGPNLADFVINDVVHPGLCGLSPTQGFIGDQVTAQGEGFGTSPSTVSFGSSSITSFSAWGDTSIVMNVPTVGVGKQVVKVITGNFSSNPVAFTVKNKAMAGLPTITEVDPAVGPIAEYITLYGTNFGSNLGTVRFRNKTTGQEALADTAFPAACAQGFWTGTRIVVKVPPLMNGGGAVVPGDYAIRVIRSDNASSNEKDVVVNTATPKPGICAISPTVGPVGTAVTISGDRFGNTTQSVTFHQQKSAIASSWAQTEVKTSAPVGAASGPVRLKIQGVDSNSVNFEVRNCNEQPGICAANEQCCANGSCGQSCGAVTQQAMYAWQSSTGLIPVSPRVVEQCAPSEVPMPIPSPSPWDQRAGGNEVCVTSAVSIRFTTHLDPTTVTKANVTFKKCSGGGNDPCTTTTDVPIAAGFPSLQPASQDEDAVFIQSQQDLDPSTTYLVHVMTGVKGAGSSGAEMEERSECGNGVAYCFRFKTRASTQACAVGAVSVSPHPYAVHTAGEEIPYKATPVSSDDKCVSLKCEAFDWSWDTEQDGRAMFQQPLAINQSNQKVSCRQTGVAITETGNVPVHMNATAQPDAVKGTALLTISFLPPHIVDYAPRCESACLNARVWASFSGEIDPASLVGNVEVRPCANENCILSDLGTPLPIPVNQIYLKPFSPTDLKMRKVVINPAKPGVIPNTLESLLEPGKFYRVLLKGGTDLGIRGTNGVPMAGLNDPDGFVWTFRTKVGEDAFCTAESVSVTPGEKIETVVGARQVFSATAFGKPDECSITGQELFQTSDAEWKTSQPNVADYVDNGSIDTGAPLPPRCDERCLEMGSQGVFGKVAMCGNSIIETTDANYCQSGQTPFGDACSVFAAGSNAGEECDPGIQSNVGRCNASTCLWKPVAQVPNGTCGNGSIEQGEACDVGSFCLGSSAVADMASCTDAADKAACETGGGTCAPRQYRGCSAFCRNTGSQSGNSTCGNSDIADGEDCDDGNLTNNDGCSSQCLHTGSQATVVSVCGNGILEPGETCEKNDAGCDAVRCLHVGSSLCDNDPNTPNVDCCGNASIDAGEDCDDGNKLNNDGCSVSCLLEGSSVGYPTPSFCSDGIPGKGEQCEATLFGDGITDDVQLAEIIGDAEPDQSGKMTSVLSATTLGKTGEATYGLQCGFADEASCPSVPLETGLTDAGCCSARPTLATSYPNGTGVCRNTLISATFNVDMNVDSVVSNVQIASEIKDPTCPNGTVQVADDFSPVHSGRFAWVSRLWRRVVAWWKGDPAIASIWCAGSATGSWVPATSGSKNAFAFKLDAALAPKTTYRVKFLGDNSAATDPLADNADLAKRVGIKTSRGVVAPFDSSANAGPLTFSFETGNDICLANVIQVTDYAEDHPLLFVKNGEQHPFGASVVSMHNGMVQTIVPVAEYGWDWLPWVSSKEDIVTITQPSSPLMPPNSATVNAQNKSGNAFVVAWIEITSDTVSTPSTVGRAIQGSAPVTVSLCANPWPSLTTAPFRDKQPTGQDSSLVGTIFENGPYFNFSTSYCRDSGTADESDDLPALVPSFVPPTTTDKAEGILRQYLFTYGSDHPELKKDGIGIRIATNPLHYTPLDWYRRHNFVGSPRTISIDGYQAIQDGTTTYISAANTDGFGKKIYSNVYIVSHNPDASEMTIGIYNQLISSLAFNINFTEGVSNVCVEGNNPNEIGNPPYVDPKGQAKTVACSTDFDCLKISDDLHCDSFKQKIARDMIRIADYQTMSNAAERARSSSGTYPKLSNGTFLQGLTNSRWPSWAAELSSETGTTWPTDPVNQFVTCGRCSLSHGVCSVNSDCPADQTCLGVTVRNGVSETSTSTEVSTCWDTATRTFLCPNVKQSPSRAYQYRSLNGGQRYEIASEFEVPPPIQKNADWWEVPLITEIRRCTNGTSTTPYLCVEDMDCRPCANPRDNVTCPENLYPITNGACKAVGGRFVYNGMCQNALVGLSGSCGDGVIGSACTGGTNAGNACTVAADCPGGSCDAAELCEISQTQNADCTTADNKDGVKVQVCSECKEFVDLAGVSQCIEGVKCGNGRVDQKCDGGIRDGLSCTVSAECVGDANTPAGSCVPSAEVCDDGVLNGTYGHCNLSCSGFGGYCGDSQLSPGESCDAGAQNGEYCGQNCDVSLSCGANCQGVAPYCGDGTITSPEQCDGQTETTQLAVCSSGTAKDQPCTTDADCGTGGTCGGGILASCQNVTKTRCATSLKQCVTPSLNSCTNYDPLTHKVCQADADCVGQPNGQTACRALQDFCFDCSSDTQCSFTGIPGSCNAMQTSHIRTCNTGGQHQCSYTDWSSCTILGFCGDGTIDDTSEECDDGASNGDTKSCTASCKKNVCGDGKPFVGVEECDTGSQNGTVTCNADYNSTCQSCSTQCKFSTTAGGYCGDQVKNGPEQCDGNTLVEGIADQFPDCLSSGKPTKICPFVNADCLQSPCKQTTETGVTCQSLGYDFASNGVRPQLTYLDAALKDPDSTSACPEYQFMKKYEIKAFETCLGMKCNPKACIVSGVTPGSCQVLAPKIQYTKTTPSVDDFWKCVREQAAPLGVGITTDQQPVLLSCGNSCSFTGCGRCSDEGGTGVISGQLVDAVYNQVIPGARVSLFSKGVLVTQKSSDDDGKFVLTGLNDRPECGSYKIVVDKYDDNPCTGNAVGRPSCGKTSGMPPWTYSYDVKENDRGGYWPMTSKTFSVGTYQAVVSPQTAVGQMARIFIFPRPAAGEAYFSVMWDKDWSGSDGGTTGWNNNHLILPESRAYAVPNGVDMDASGYPMNYTAASCVYANGPTGPAGGAASRQCARDVTSRGDVMGFADLSKPPYARLICLHSPGDKVVGRGDASLNGCPVEGYAACLASKGGVDPNHECTKGVEPWAFATKACEGGYYDVHGSHPRVDCQSDNDCVPLGGNCVTVADPTPHGECASGALQGQACANHVDCQAPGGLCKDQPNSTPICTATWWDSCDFYKNGPLTTYFRYAAYAGSSEPLKMLWGTVDYPTSKSIWPALNTSQSLLRNFLGWGGSGKKFHAVISTDTQLVELVPPTQDTCGKDCKFWYLGNVNPSDGSVTVKNTLAKGRSGDTAGVAIYEWSFQGAHWWDANNDQINDIKFCMDNTNLYKAACTTNADCPAGTGTCQNPSWVQWSKASY